MAKYRGKRGTVLRTVFYRTMRLAPIADPGDLDPRVVIEVLSNAALRAMRVYDDVRAGVESYGSDSGQDD